MKIQGDEISGYESSMGRKFRHENTIYVNEIYEYSIDLKKGLIVLDKSNHPKKLWLKKFLTIQKKS